MDFAHLRGRVVEAPKTGVEVADPGVSAGLYPRGALCVFECVGGSGTGSGWNGPDGDLFCSGELPVGNRGVS